MSRDLDSTMAAEMVKPAIRPAILCMLTFATATRYLWTGAGTLQYGGQNYLGVGSFGALGNIAEGVEVKADGTSVTLSGIDPIYLAESMTDVQLGAPAKLWLAMIADDQTVVGVPYLLFAGVVDQPTVNVQADTVSIMLALENKMVNLQRATNRRYTANDQHVLYPTDTSMNRVEGLNDEALKWGTA